MSEGDTEQYESGWISINATFSRCQTKVCHCWFCADSNSHITNEFRVDVARVVFLEDQKLDHLNGAWVEIGLKCNKKSPHRMNESFHWFVGWIVHYALYKLYSARNKACNVWWMAITFETQQNRLFYNRVYFWPSYVLSHDEFDL